MSTATLELKHPLASYKSTPSRLGYSPALDGLRGVAIIAVLLVHTKHLFGWSVLPGGNIGVDVFFTLSGYLITRLLLEEQAHTGSISLKNFYLRRILRLIPGLIFVVTFIYFFADKIWPAPEAAHTRNAIPIALAYASDIALATGWYLPLGALNHTWSLAIEEHFYLLWPPILLVALKLRIGPRRLLLGLLVVGLMSALLRFVMTLNGASPIRTYYGMDTRCDALLIGCATGVAVAWGLARSIESFTAPAIMTLLVIAATTDYSTPMMHLGGFTLVAIATAVLLVNLTGEYSLGLQRVLEFGPLVGIGRVSYGIYLWHYAIFRMVGHFEIGMISKLVVAVTLTLIVSWLSFYMIEKPALRLKRRLAASGGPTIGHAVESC